MKKLVVVMLIITLSFTSLFSETLEHSSLKYEYESYEEEEFPIWSIELRRAETLFFGSFVFTLPLSTAAVSLMAGANMLGSVSSTKSAVISLSAAAVLSLCVSTIDWVLGRVQN